MKLPLLRLATRLINTPLMITEDKFRVILGVVGPRLRGDDVEIDPATLLPQGKAARSEQAPMTHVYPSGVAVIDVSGSLVHRSGWLDAMSGLVSYEAISNELDAALNNPNVRAIMLNIDSPGGEVAGSFDLAARIRAGAARKPISALASDLAASAGYLLGSSATRFYATEAAITGSVGVVVGHIDVSERDRAMGVKVTHIHAGSRKVDGNPHEPLNDEGRETLQALVDKMYGVFVSRVATYRGISEEAVRATEARIYVGADAEGIGLINGVRTADQVMEELIQQSNRVGGGSSATANRPARPAKAGGSMTEQEMEQLRAALAAVTTERDALKATVSEQTTKLAELSAQVTGLAAERKASVVEKHVMAGRVTPAMRADVELMGAGLSAEDLDARLAKWPVLTRPNPSGTSAGAEETEAPKAPIELLNEAAAKLRAADPKLTGPDAFTMACQQNPEVYKAHRKLNTRVVSAVKGRG